MKATFDRWPEPLRLKRGLYNGGMVRIARESRGISRARLAHRLGMTAREYAPRESGWALWSEAERATLHEVTHYPPHFFTQDEYPPIATGPVFICGQRHCEMSLDGWP